MLFYALNICCMNGNDNESITYEQHEWGHVGNRCKQIVVDDSETNKVGNKPR